MKPDLTVIVPLHNGAGTIADTLSSLGLQQLAPDEVLVVDDGSTDAGPEIAESHPLAPCVIRLDGNYGVAYARNTGLAEASSRWVAFLDQDDLWLPARWRDLEKIVSTRSEVSAVVTDELTFAMEADRPGLATHPFASWIDHWLAPCGLDRQLLSMPSPPIGGLQPVSQQRLISGPISKTTSYVLNRRRALQAGGFAPWLRSGDDWVLLQTLATHGTVLHLDSPTCLYRVHPANTSLSTEWPMPMMAAAAGLRFGRGLVSSSESRDPIAVGRLSNSPFLSHLLDQAASTRGPSAFGDALAAWQLLATDGVDRRASLARLLRGAARARTPPRIVDLRRRLSRRPHG